MATGESKAATNGGERRAGVIGGYSAAVPAESRAAVSDSSAAKMAVNPFKAVLDSRYAG